MKTSLIHAGENGPGKDCCLLMLSTSEQPEESERQEITNILQKHTQQTYIKLYNYRPAVFSGHVNMIKYGG